MIKYHRKSIRLKDYDYSSKGHYSITMCTKNGECLFGEIIDGQMRVNEFGEIVKNEWLKTPQVRSNVKSGEFIVMPNHMHGIICIVDDGRGTAHRALTLESFGRPVPGSIPTVIRSFKSAVTKHINELRHTPRSPIWQRGYYDHIIRDEMDLNRIREYIQNNPLAWDEDENNPSKITSL